ncbi:SAM-dependent methyltransferase [Providencia alcalifaciens]|uniref:SAM-dependent methyltransferase n=1 Tax=Providencia alcalifaciens TaxID=126385 RepID=UPI000D858B62|nr:class I SAM-dependent methyltransferase [Providencia alcalifaciens]MTC28065.1 methyltransferase domain-containing protein [Providencia alcalifaciens]SPY75163.1 cyclopropane fatty acyl phospholipid synthase [Providencia alcalifaciens]
MDPLLSDGVPQCGAKYHVIHSVQHDEYGDKVALTYSEDPEKWKKAIGELLLFQFGVYDGPFIANENYLDGRLLSSLDKSGLRYLNQQLFLAGVTGSNRPAVGRILDLGCGWGYTLKYLAEYFTECATLDGINISVQQLDYCDQLYSDERLRKRINLYLCQAHDLSLLPDEEKYYDLAIIRGVISHFTNDVFEKVFSVLYPRLRKGGKIIISDNLYNIELDEYQSDTPDEVDRLACKYRKTPKYVRQVIEHSGFVINDFRVLPSNIDVARWLMESKANIERHFPEGVDGALEELRVLAENFSVALLKNKVSTYSIIVEKK